MAGNRKREAIFTEIKDYVEKAGDDTSKSACHILVGILEVLIDIRDNANPPRILGGAPTRGVESRGLFGLDCDERP